MHISSYKCKACASPCKYFHINKERKYYFKCKLSLYGKYCKSTFEKQLVSYVITFLVLLIVKMNSIL